MSSSFLLLLLQSNSDHHFLLYATVSCDRRLRCFSFSSNLSPTYPSPSRSQFLGPYFPQRYTFSLRFSLNRNSNPNLSLSTIDHDRPLTKSGQADAAKVAQILSTLGWIPQLILSRSQFQNPELIKFVCFQ